MEVAHKTLLALMESSDFTNPTKEEVLSYRLRHQLSKKEVAKLAGVSVRTWERYEAGELKLSSSSWLYMLLIINEVPSVRVLIL